VRFWDTSAIIPLLLEQEASAEVRPLAETDPDMVAWWGTPLECASAVARLRREGVLSLDEEDEVLGALALFREAWVEVLPGAEVQREAMRLLRIHPLKAADALQLGAARVWAGADLVTLDERLALAARLEGFTVLP
jgi:uncharacterized protein